MSNDKKPQQSQHKIVSTINKCNNSMINIGLLKPKPKPKSITTGKKNG